MLADLSRLDSFLFCGLGSLADQIMVSTGRYVRFATQFGVYKIQRNILAIQQTLCNITEGADDSILSKAQRYWQLYDLGPKVSQNPTSSSVLTSCGRSRQCWRNCKARNPSSHSTNTTTCLIYSARWILKLLSVLAVARRTTGPAAYRHSLPSTPTGPSIMISSSTCTPSPLTTGINGHRAFSSCIAD
jgi:hypothetical protein